MHSPFIMMYFFFIVMLLTFNRLECEAIMFADTINVSTPLTDNAHDTLVSVEKRFELGFFTPQGSEKRYVGIWYYYKKKNIPRTVVWVANRDEPLDDPCAGVFGIAEDGNIKIWCNSNTGVVVPVTSLDTSTSSNRSLQLLDSGNLVLVDGQSEERLWQSFDYPTDTFLPGMKMNDNGMELISWNSPTDPGKGNYTFRREQGVYSIQKRSTVYWKSGEPGPFFLFNNKLPSAVTQILSNSSGTVRYWKPISQQPTVISPTIRRNTTRTRTIIIPINRGMFFPPSTRPHTKSRILSNSRILMKSSGEIQCYINNMVEGEWWSLLWSEPQTGCSVYGACGNFGICNETSDPICHCLPGFRPVSPGDWSAGQYSEGCVRKEPLISSQSQTYRFVNLSFVTQIGGTVQSFDRAQQEATCEDECLNNIKCQAYLYTERKPTNREIGKSVVKCWIWTSDLVNLQEDYSGSTLNISLRIVKSATRICQPCVSRSIPYPLSVGRNCGDPLYHSFHCNSSTGKISFEALSGKYQVTDIYNEKRRFVILVDVDSQRADTCNVTKLSSQILKLNQSLPFTVTNWCYTATPSLKTENRVAASHIEIGWEPPLEPTCDLLNDCKDWPNSDCNDKDGQRRCYCNQSYQWDGSTAICALAPTKSSLQPSRNKSRRIYVIVFTILAVGIILAVGCSSYILYRRKRMAKRKDETERQVNDLMMRENNQGNIDVPFYNLDVILSATDNFSDANMLGRGGFGPVYKGKFPGGSEIAVKRLSSFSGQGIEEFRNEVILIAKLQHRNLVRLLGYCITEKEKILLYEYMPNRSLDAFIFDQSNGLILDWNQRYNIILGIARGLLYLHQDSRLRIIHRDMKTSNILLDEDMNPKISDFGLAKIVEGKETEASTNRVVGTYGYMSPEYALDGKFSIKSDVFSFGVVMLEIISGKKNTGFYNPQQVLNLLGYAWGLWIENKAIELVDPVVVESCEECEVIKCINVGLLCVQEDPNDRPSMSTVVVMIGSENTNSIPFPTKPAFVVRRHHSSTSSSTSTKPDTISSNLLTVSTVEGR
ncbi:hypothetical protein ACP275_08G116200 [Erythranthe tilingii]